MQQAVSIRPSFPSIRKSVLPFVRPSVLHPSILPSFRQSVRPFFSTPQNNSWTDYTGFRSVTVAHLWQMCTSTCTPVADVHVDEVSRSIDFQRNRQTWHSVLRSNFTFGNFTASQLAEVRNLFSFAYSAGCYRRGRLATKSAVILIYLERYFAVYVCLLVSSDTQKPVILWIKNYPEATTDIFSTRCRARTIQPKQLLDWLIGANQSNCMSVAYKISTFWLAGT